MCDQSRWPARSADPQGDEQVLGHARAETRVHCAYPGARYGFATACVRERQSRARGTGLRHCPCFVDAAANPDFCLSRIVHHRRPQSLLDQGAYRSRRSCVGDDAAAEGVSRVTGVATRDADRVLIMSCVCSRPWLNSTIGRSEYRCRTGRGSSDAAALSRPRLCRRGGAANDLSGGRSSPGARTRVARGSV